MTTESDGQPDLRARSNELELGRLRHRVLALREELARSVCDEGAMRRTLTVAQESGTEWRTRALAAEARIRELESMNAK